MSFLVLSFVFANVFKVTGASEMIMNMMKYVPSVNSRGGNRPETEEDRGEVELQDVVFCYPSKPDVQILKKVSFKVEQNKVIALVGQSGCGKSTIISLIERFYDTLEGQILFNGTNIKTLDPKWYKKQISIVSQEPVLFSGTIRENICYGLNVKEVTEAQLDEACARANALTFIKDKDMFPNGYDTLVGERGVKLSGGQKQRVAIARALINKPKLLLFDEATSALDAESEHLVQKSLEELMAQGKQTIIVIAHRLSTIRSADKIIVMNAGEVAEQGTHEELLRNPEGVYSKLIQRQLDNQAKTDSPVKQEEVQLSLNE